jgi:hypothetical protein
MISRSGQAGEHADGHWHRMNRLKHQGTLTSALIMPDNSTDRARHGPGYRISYTPRVNRRATRGERQIHLGSPSAFRA